MKKSNKTLVLAVSSTLIVGLSSVAIGDEFKLTELSSGYMQLAAADAATAKPDAKAKATEGKCAGTKPVAAPKAAEAKCGEGQCGGDMKKAAEDAKKASSEADKKSTETTKSATDTKSAPEKKATDDAKATDSKTEKK